MWITCNSMIMSMAYRDRVCLSGRKMVDWKKGADV